MINTSNRYSEWENIVGKGRILPAFPGAGGSIDDGILHAKLTPAIIQPTTFGEIDENLRDRTVYKEKDVMLQTAVSLKRNFKILSKKGMLSPFKFHFVKICPTYLLKVGLSFVFKSEFGNVFMYRHAMKSPEEMRRLHNEFYNIIDTFR